MRNAVDEPREQLTSDIRTWGEQLSSALYRLDPVDEDHGPFHASIRSKHIGDVTFALIESDPHHLVRTPQVDGSEGGTFGLSLQLSGRSIVHQLGETYVLDPGDYCIYDARLPSAWMCEGPTSVFIVVVPQSLLARRERQLHEGASIVKKPVGSLDSLSTDLLLGVSRQLDDLDESNGYRVARGLFQFLSASLAPDEPEAPREDERLRADVLQHVDENLTDPALSPSSVASHFYMSTRRLFELFSGEERTLSRIIRDERILLAENALLDPGLRSIPIAQVSEACGFDDASYFARVFKRRHGVTPTEYRLRAAMSHVD